MMEIPEPTVRATVYEVCCLPEDDYSAPSFTVRVEYRGSDRWAVVRGGGRHLGVDGTWSYGYVWRDGTQGAWTDEEHREYADGHDAWLAEHRFDLDTALELAKREAPLVKVNGWTVAAVLADREEMEA